MSFFHRAALYFHTLRYLKPVQVLGRVAFRLRRPKPDLRPVPERRVSDGMWLMPAARRPSMLSPMRFRFLNAEHETPLPALPRLWLYNLHYFDDLNAEGAVSRVVWHRDLIARWIAENPPGAGIGWEPYPLSLRIVNWVKWALAGNVLNETARQSLAVQIRYLTGRLEHHLLGNHLFSNAKALIFAGCFFEDEEASEWLQCGLAILEREIPEQILSDGGQFERSTMYHALAYEDMLDLVNLAAAFPQVIPPALVKNWAARVREMGRWLLAICHPDGEIAFFNDAAIGIAPTPAELFGYATRLGFVTPIIDDVVMRLDPSGYIRVQQGEAVLFLDVAPIGPDYLPGHAHADTLSFELSLFGKRLLVNGGTSCYGSGSERQRQRGTAAHNAVVVDGQNSSEIWQGFRVARRAYPGLLALQHDGGNIAIEASHDGYQRLSGKNIHRRRWVLRAHSLIVEDMISGHFGEAEAHFHLHPDVKVVDTPEDAQNALLRLPDGREIRIGIEGGKLRQVPDVWHPEFGISLPSACLSARFMANKLRTTIDWDCH